MAPVSAAALPEIRVRRRSAPAIFASTVPREMAGPDGIDASQPARLSLGVA